jgi:uncharacterized membrane protein
MAPFAARARALVAAAAILGAVGCGVFFQTIDEYPCPTEGTRQTFDNFGGLFLARYCQRCHGSTAVDRFGAPGEFIFDTKEQAQRHRARIFVRAAADNTTMPPGPDDPPRDQRFLLAEWLACGAP